MNSSRISSLLGLGLVALAIAVLMLHSSRTAVGQQGEEPAGDGSAIELLDAAPKQAKDSVVKTDEEWREQLSKEEYHILRQAGTEPHNGQAYQEFKQHGEGTYYCAGCGAELFSSKEKFDSHCGWPSFYDPSRAKNVKYKVDFHLGYARTEVRCKVCDGHLGHVFMGEGFPTPTDKRYCINGTVLKFVPKKKTNSPDSVVKQSGGDGAPSESKGASEARQGATRPDGAGNAGERE